MGNISSETLTKNKKYIYYQTEFAQDIIELFQNLLNKKAYENGLSIISTLFYTVIIKIICIPVDIYTYI